MVIVTGSRPPDICGVGDYIDALTGKLKNRIDRVTLFYKNDWSIKCLFRYAREIQSLHDPIVNIQYPTEGYKYSLVPQLLCALLSPAKTIVTLHEFIRKSLKGKLAIYLFFLFADWIIFTTESERDAACHVAPWVCKKSCVIPIGSNIPMRPKQVPDTDVVYFGQIRPVKGLEEFVAVTRLLANRRHLKIQMIGQISPGYEDYASTILDLTAKLGVEVILNRSSDDVSILLSRARIALLPLPCGISLRHGSVLAAMGNGALVISKPPMDGTKNYREICLTAQSTDALCQLVLDVMENYDSYRGVWESGQKFAMSISWDSIAMRYVNLVTQLCRS